MAKSEPAEHPLLNRLSKTLYKLSPGLQYRLIQSYDSRLSRVDYENENKFVFPRIVDIELTVLCNLRCRMCWWWGENGIGHQLLENKDPLIVNQMTKKEVTSLIDQIASNRSRIYFSGAEIFSRRDAIDIIEYASNKGIPVALTTNGTLIDDKTSRRLSQLSKLRLNFSIDGPEDVHDKIRGTGNYKKTISTIERIVDYRSNKNSPMITTNTTFSPEILGRTTEMIHNLSRTGVDSISFQHLWFTSENRINYNNQILSRRFKILNDCGPNSHLITTFSADYIDKLSEEVCLLQTKRYEVPVRVNPRLTKDEVVKYYYDLNFTVRKFCDIPWNKILIKANGDALFCPDEWITEFKLGNVRKASLLDLWNSDQAKIFRQSMLKDGLLPVCARCCSINMS